MMRRYFVPGSWREMDRLQRQMNRLFDNYNPARFQGSTSYPAMNIWANQDGLVVTTEVPGIRPENLDINVVGDMLTLSGESVSEPASENLHYHRQERTFGAFTRSLQLPYQIDAQKVSAQFKNGILSIELPRAEADKPHKISVSVK